MANVDAVGMPVESTPELDHCEGAVDGAGWWTWSDRSRCIDYGRGMRESVQR